MTHFDPEAREREARAEIDATRIPAGLARTVVAAAMLVIAAGPALELAAAASGGSRIFARLPESAGTGSGARGALARARAVIDELEQRYDHHSRLVQLVRGPAQGLLFAACRYGNERAHVGREGWLFFAPDFEHVTRRERAADAAGDPVRAILGFRDALAARGVALVVLPAPVKTAVQPRRWVGRAPDPPLRPARERELLARLAAAGVEVVDVAERLAHSAVAEGDAYLARDTHWRPGAVDEVARELAVALRSTVDLAPGDPSRWREERIAIDGRGDLVELLGLPAGAEPLPRERVELGAVVGAADGSPWRPERGAPVLVLGDSFTAVFSQGDLGWGSGAGLAERLAFHLGLPVDRIVRNAGGASATREALAAELAADPARLDGVRAVVWQFAAREITQGQWRATVW